MLQKIPCNNATSNIEEHYANSFKPTSNPPLKVNNGNTRTRHDIQVTNNNTRTAQLYNAKQCKTMRKRHNT